MNGDYELIEAVWLQHIVANHATQSMVEGTNPTTSSSKLVILHDKSFTILRCNTSLVASSIGTGGTGRLSSCPSPTVMADSP